MSTKINIVLRLIKDNHITIEEGILLLEKEYHYIPQYLGYVRGNNNFYNPPYQITCNSTGNFNNSNK